MLVKRAAMFPVECVARGYLAGSGWKEYQASGTVCGIPLPAGLLDGSQLPEPIFTPATKSQDGAHDENISFEADGGGSWRCRCGSAARSYAERFTARRTNTQSRCGLILGRHKI